MMYYGQGMPGSYPASPSNGDFYTDTITWSVYEFTGEWVLSQGGSEGADWHGNRSNERFTYKRVKWAPGQVGHFGEMESYGFITKGSVELAAYTDLKASASFEFEGGTPPDTTDLVRIYYSFDDDNGRHAETAIGTFFVSYGDIEYAHGTQAVQRGSVTGVSTLSVLLNKQVGFPYTVPAGVDCVDMANYIVEGLGLPTNSPDSPGTLTQTSHVFEPDDSYITVVNWLLTSANYQAVWPDAFGTVMIVPYVDPEARAVVESFADDGESVMLPVVSVENDWSETPNVVRLCYQSDDECLIASASMLSGSRVSLAARGNREVTLYEQVDELGGETQADRISNLEQMARKKLINNTSEIEKVGMTHAFLPSIRPNDAIEIQYADMTWKGNVTNMDIDLETSIPCQTKIRRFVPNSLVIETDGEAIW